MAEAERSVAEDHLRPPPRNPSSSTSTAGSMADHERAPRRGRSVRRKQTMDVLASDLQPRGAPRRDERSWWARWHRTVLVVFLVVVAIVVSTAVTALYTIRSYFGVYEADVISPDEVALFNQSSTSAGRRIPRIIHQTWKSDVIPEKWVAVRQSCEVLHPSVTRTYESALNAGVGDEPFVGERDDGKWEYMLWSDEASRDFIKREYDWFLPTFDGYAYPIQRADAIRYFVLHHYGGVYMDLDVGCRRPIDPLLYFDVILPVTVPVGVSNDLMFSSRKHPFMALAIHSLLTLDHSYGTNYPTVMFSTGPMAISWVYGQWRRHHDTSSHPTLDRDPSLPGAVRVLPKELYGKNAEPDVYPDSFFSHFYGSSWHTDDSGFIIWLGKSFRFLLWLGAVVAIIGLVREGVIRTWGARRVGKFRRAAGAVVGAAGASVRSGGHGTPVASSPLPFAFEGLSPVVPETNSAGGRLGGRFRRGQLFFLPAYWVSDSRPPSPGARSASSHASAASWSSYLGFFASPMARATGYRELATSDEASDSEAAATAKIDMQTLDSKGKAVAPAVFSDEEEIQRPPPPVYTPANSTTIPGTEGPSSSRPPSRSQSWESWPEGAGR